MYWLPNEKSEVMWSFAPKDFLETAKESDLEGAATIDGPLEATC